jgi:hypothetical protein
MSKDALNQLREMEFWGRHRFPDFNAAAAALRDWESFPLALKGRTPAEKLAALHPPERVA